MVLRLYLPPFPCNRRVFGTRTGAVQGARFMRGGGKSFLRLKRFCSADPGQRGPFWNVKKKGKAAGVSGGVPLAGFRGGAPRTFPRAVWARGIQLFAARCVPLRCQRKTEKYL